MTKEMGLETILSLQSYYAVAGILFNLISFLSVVFKEERLTPTNPVSGIAAMVAFGATVGLGMSPEYRTLYAVLLCAWVLIIGYGGVHSHIIERSKHDLKNYSGMLAWISAIGLNMFGIMMMIAGVIVVCDLPPTYVIPLWVFLFLQLLRRANSAIQAGSVSDTSWTDFKCESTRKWQLSSQYIQMPDGTKLACDIYLPVTKDTDKFPTMLHLTRYNRNWKVSFPFNLFLGSSYNVRSLLYVEKFVASGYAWVTVDVRGTGASGGSRPVDFSPQEVSDISTVLQWTLAQSFCNGKIGSCGISYDALSALYVASTNNPAVKAIAPLFYPVDLYEDLIAPGGLTCNGFVEEYSIFTKALETANISMVKPILPSMMYQLFSTVLSGVMPVTGSEKELDDQLKQHAENWDMSSLYSKTDNKDRVIVSHGGTDYRAKDFGPTSCMDNLKRCRGLPVYTIAGYYDSAAVGSAVKLHDELKVAGLKPKLTIGPWTHGCRRNCSPYAVNSWPSFDMYEELVRFFNYHLCGKNHGIADEADVHYWCVGEEAWRESSSFPPTVSPQRFFLGNQGRLVTMQPGASSLPVPPGIVADQWMPDYEVGSGKCSRWNLTQHIAKQLVAYPDRAAKGPSYLVYATLPLENDVMITGTPVVNLRIEMDAPEGSIFVYLEEEVSEDNVLYVTEGQLLASHRKGTYLQADRKVLPVVDDGPSQSTVEHLRVKMQPVAWKFSQGSRIRLSIGAADIDNFLPHDADELTHSLLPNGGVPFVANRWWVHRGQSAPSMLELPIDGEEATFLGEQVVAEPEKKEFSKPPLPKGMSWRSQKIKGRRWSSTAPVAAVEEYKKMMEEKKVAEEDEGGE